MKKKTDVLTHRCSICNAEFASGSGGKAGRDDGRPLCNAHYNRAIRGSPRADDPEIGRERQVAATMTYRPDAEALALLTAFRSALSADGRERSWSETISAAIKSSRQVQTFAKRGAR